MRKILLSLAVVMFVVVSMLNLHAASLAGVTLPDTAQVGGKALVLNGLGLRTEFMVKVYVAGLYLEQKSSDPSAILKADAPNRIVMQFLHGASQSQMANAFKESFNDNTPDAMKTMKPDIDRLLGALEPIKAGRPDDLHLRSGHGYDFRHQRHGQVDHCRFGFQSGALVGVARAEAAHCEREKRDAGEVDPTAGRTPRSLLEQALIVYPRVPRNV